MNMFESTKSTVKKFKKKKTMNCAARLFNIRDVLKIKQISLNQYTELIQLTSNRGS